jgi:hypothetical protein
MNENDTLGAVPGLPKMRKRTAADRFVEDIQIANAKIDGHLDVPALRRTLDQEPDVAAFKSKVADPIIDRINGFLAGEPADGAPRFTSCPHCGGELEAPTPEVSVGLLVTWQKDRPVYFQWSPYELRQLLEHLHAHRGSVPIPRYSQSCDIREPSGRIYAWHRDGKVT